MGGKLLSLVVKYYSFYILSVYMSTDSVATFPGRCDYHYRYSIVDVFLSAERKNSKRKINFVNTDLSVQAFWCLPFSLPCVFLLFYIFWAGTAYALFEIILLFILG